jgi:glutaredoxin
MMLRFLSRLFGNIPAIPVVIYTRANCHLCDDAKTLIEKHSGKYGLALEIVDVDADPKLRAAYDEKVPVVVIQGVERFFGKVNETLLIRQLEACRKK